MATSAVNEANFESEVKNSTTPVLVDFWAEWCGPCRMIAPILEELSQELQGQVKIVKLDVDHNQQVAQDYGVRNIPMLLLFKDGEVLGQKVGAQPKHQLKSWLVETVGIKD